MYASKKVAKEVIEQYKEQTYYFDGELSVGSMKQMLRIMKFGDAEVEVIIAALVLAGAKFTIE